MATYFGLWKINNEFASPSDPNMNVVLQESFLATIKEQLSSGLVKEAHSFLEGDRGYFTTGDISEEKMLELCLQWSPYVTFEIHQTVRFPRPQELGVALMKQRAERASSIKK